MSGRIALFFLSAGLLLGGCSNDGTGTEPVAASSDGSTVAAAVAGSRDHRKLAAALTDTQLAPVLDGKGDYTLLAPGDAAFGALGDKAVKLGEQERRPLMIAVLRGHILPGQVTSEAIEAAIARKQGTVAMRTMAGGTVIFAKAGEGFSVSNGAQTATLGTSTIAASNGAVLPIDRVLLPPQ